MKTDNLFVFPALLTLERDQSRDSRGLLALLAAGGLFFYLAAALLNPGIVAMDDYFEGIARFVPAQAHGTDEIIASAGIRSPLPLLLPFGLARLALSLGIQEPRAQFHFVLGCLSCFAFLVLFAAGVGHFPSTTATGAPTNGRRRRVIAFLIGFYFLCPLFLSRAMVEALSAPWLLASSFFACRYWARPSRGTLVLAALCLGAAALMRFQAGVCALALLLVVLLRRRAGDVLLTLALFALGFLVTGAVDWWLRGTFHASLLAYVRYNVAHSSDFGVTPWWVFSALFIGLAWPPFIVSRYRNFPLREAYGPLVPALLFFLVFVAAHSAVPHKEERFMIPAIPIFLVLMTPVAAYFVTRARTEGGGSAWRVRIFLGVNAVLLVLATFFPPQKTALDLASFTQQNPAVSRVYLDGFLIFPQALVDHPVAVLPIQEAATVGANDCSSVAVTFALGAVPPVLMSGWQRIARFEPGPLEKLVVILNPLRNARRRALELYAKPGCSYPPLASH